jgi:predicted PurR-regulated permease PerM
MLPLTVAAGLRMQGRKEGRMGAREPRDATVRRTPGEINVRVSNRTILTVLGLLGLIWLLRHATHIFTVLFIALLLATSLSSAANGLARYRVKRGMAILIVYIGILLVIGGVVALLVPLIANEVRTLRTNLPDYERRVNGLLAHLPKGSDGEPLQINDVFSRIGSELNGAAGQVGRGAAQIGAALVTLLIIFVMAYFLAADVRFAERIVRRFIPPAARGRTLGIMGRIGTSLGFWVRAQLLLALFFGVAFGIGMLILRVPYAFTLGVLGAVLEIIPYVGGVVTIVLAVLVALTTGKLWLVIAVVIWYTIVVNLEAHVVAPKLVGQIVGLHPLVVVLALFLGAETLGILGALLAVPIAVIVQTLLDEFWRFDEPDEPDGAQAADAAATEQDGPLFQVGTSTREPEPSATGEP